MPCIGQELNQTPWRKQQIASAIERLNRAIETGTVTVVIGAQGGIAFKGWQDNAGVSDLCAYRKLAAENSPALRKALARAEVVAGRRLDQRAVAAGVHSHDGGRTWGAHAVLGAVALVAAQESPAHSGHAAAEMHSHFELLVVIVGVAIAALFARRRARAG